VSPAFFVGLNYFYGGYLPNDLKVWDTPTDRFEAATGSSDLEVQRFNLYKGNIGHMVNIITDPTNQSAITLGNACGYDQLNRINSS